MHREECLAELPPELRDVVAAQPIPGGYYVTWRRSLLFTTADGIDIFYGLNPSDREGVCKYLLDHYARIDNSAKCTAPLQKDAPRAPLARPFHRGRMAS